MDTHRKVKRLYAKGLSGSEISEKVDIHIRQVYRILEKLGVSRRTSAEQNKIRFLRSPSSYKFKENCLSKDRDLLIAGLMLYYGEGAKTNRTVDFANSDVRMLKIFIKFLRVICGVQEKRLRFYLYYFSDQDPKKLINFWSKELK